MRLAFVLVSAFAFTVWAFYLDPSMVRLGYLSWNASAGFFWHPVAEFYRMVVRRRNHYICHCTQKPSQWDTYVGLLPFLVGGILLNAHLWRFTRPRLGRILPDGGNVIVSYDQHLRTG